MPLQAQTATTGPAGSAQPAQRIVYGSGNTRIAVLLELNSESFARASQAVLAGLRSALARDGQGFSLEVFPLSDSNAELDAALDAVASRRMAMAIGPLTRSAVDTLLDRGPLPVPVLALNQPDPARTVPANLVQFGLSIEAESRQLAQVAYDEARGRLGADGRMPAALVVSNAAPLSRRAAASFVEAWRDFSGGQSPVMLDAAGQSLTQARSQLAATKADFVFMAVNADALRNLRSQLPRETPVYGTSQLNSLMPGSSAVALADLEGVRLLDMPWLVMRDSPAVMSYPRPATAVHPDFQRLHALGIDAFRLARELSARQSRFELDGVTGRLRVDLGISSRVERTAVLAELRNGALVAIGRP